MEKIVFILSTLARHIHTCVNAWTDFFLFRISTSLLMACKSNEGSTGKRRNEMMMKKKMRTFLMALRCVVAKWFGRSLTRCSVIINSLSPLPTRYDTKGISIFIRLLCPYTC